MSGKLYCSSQCTYPCFPGVFCTSNSYDILTKPQTAFPNNHHQRKISGERGMNPVATTRQSAERYWQGWGYPPATPSSQMLLAALLGLGLRLPVIGKRKKRRNYDPSQLILAFKAVKEKGLSVYKAAKVFGVPESTLRDRHWGKQPVEDLPNPGPDPIFTKEEEKGLIEQMNYMAETGLGYTRRAFLDMAFEHAIALGKKSPGDPTFKGSWFHSFKKRWPGIQLGKPKRKVKTASAESMDKQFTDLQDIYKQLDLEQHPERVWNIDESKISIKHNPSKLLATSATKAPGRKSITLISCANATGMIIPPYFIFPGKRWFDELLQNTCPGAAGEISQTVNGCSNSAIFQNYLTNHFLRFVNIPEGQTHLIILDRHDSHISATLVDWGKTHGIVFYMVPPGMKQPLDVSCLGPLKAMYKAECQTYFRKNPGQAITRYMFGELASKAYLKAFCPSNIVTAFQKTGLYPLCKDKIVNVKTLPTLIYINTNNDAIQSGRSARESDAIDEETEQQCEETELQDEETEPGGEEMEIVTESLGNESRKECNTEGEET